MSSTNPQKYTSKLHNASILILGGTSGIGYAVAEACLEFHCARLTISGSNQPKIERTIERLRATYSSDSFPTHLSGLACDLSDTPHLEENLTALLSFATDNAQTKLDHIVNTAGDSRGTTALASVTTDIIAMAGAMRFTAPIILAKLLVPSHEPSYIHSSPTSSLTLTSGVSAAKPPLNWSVTAAFGAAKEGLTRGLAVDLAPVRVNCVAPGAVQTEYLEKVSGGDKEKLEGMLGMFRNKSLTKRVGRPEDVAEHYLGIMRDNSVTGTVLHSEGGYLLAF